MSTSYFDYMKIAFIGQKKMPSKGDGAQEYVERIAVEMAEMGHEVFVYVRNNHAQEKIEVYKKVHLIYLPSIKTKHLETITLAFFACLHCIISGYDVINFQGIGPASLCWLPKFFCSKTKIIATLHYQDYYRQKWNVAAKVFLKFAEKIACTVSDQTIAINEVLAYRAKQKYGRDIVVIPSGTETNYAAELDAISGWGLKDKKYILYVGRIEKYRGINYLIEAFKQLEDTSQTTNNFKLVIAGDLKANQEYVKYLEVLSEGRSNIVFTDFQAGETLEQLFSHAYLFVQPNEIDETSVALLEAMTYGLAPLVSNTKENIELVQDAGFYFTSKSIEELRDKISYLLIKSDLVEEYRMKAKEKINNKFSWNAIVKKTIEVYLDQINKQKEFLNNKKLAHENE